MADEEKEQLRKEIERQNRLIDILLESNKQLKQALAYCRHVADKAENHNYANDIKIDGVNQAKDEVVKIINDVNKLKDIVAELINGVNILKYPYDENINDVIQTKDKFAEIINGVNEEKHKIAENNNGGNGLPETIVANVDSILPGITSLANKNNPSKTATGEHSTTEPLANTVKTSPEDLLKLAINPVSIHNRDGKDIITRMITVQDIADGKSALSYYQLVSVLRKTIVRASDGGLENTAQILMKLHELPKQSLKSLQQLTHLSEDGITKRIRSMKKFGLIVRASGRRLLLTEKAQQLLDKAREQN